MADKHSTPAGHSSSVIPATPLSRPLLWHEGMLLSAQHFQQNDIYWAQQRCAQMSQLQPWYWGVVSMTLNAASLLDGLVQIDTLRAVLPDGTAVDIDAGTTDTALSLDINRERDVASGEVVTIHLVLPAHVDGDNNAFIQRYDTEDSRPLMDESSGENPLSIKRLKAKLGLLLADTPPPRFISIPLLKVRRNATLKFELSHYHPPLLRADASDFLGQKSIQNRLQTLLRNLRVKATRLAAIQQIFSQNLHALVCGLPQLEVLVHARQVHPFQLYQGVATLLGQISALNPNPVPPQLRIYQHDDCANGFIEAIDFIQKLIDDIPIPYRMRDFQQHEGSEHTFSYFMPVDTEIERLVIEIHPQAGQTLQYVDQWLSQACTGSQPVQKYLKQQRSPGAWVARLNNQQRFKYTHRAEAMLFELRNRRFNVADKTSKVILAGQPLLIHGNPRLDPPQRIVLYESGGDT